MNLVIAAGIILVFILVRYAWTGEVLYKPKEKPMTLIKDPGYDEYKRRMELREVPLWCETCQENTLQKLSPHCGTAQCLKCGAVNVVREGTP